MRDHPNALGPLAVAQLVGERGRWRCCTMLVATVAIGFLTTVSATLALADGGAGGPCVNDSGAILEHGGAGGSGFTGNPGNPGSGDACGGGGGGGGAGGGAGGSGGGAGGAGGAGGTAISPNGQAGSDATGAGGGGGGGGGGFNGNGAGAATLTNSSPLVGGNGGNGGFGFTGGGSFGDGPFGGGGAGGYGAIVKGSGPSLNSSSITGGNGGSGFGLLPALAGGGDGGVGVKVVAPNATFTNSGTITGGVGGFGLLGGGVGGVGVQFTAGGATFNNSGMVSGGDGINGGGVGVQFTASGAAFNNTGSVTGGGGGVGVQFMARDATFNNSGMVSGGVQFTASGATFNNSGMVSGGAEFTASGASFNNSGKVGGGNGAAGGCFFLFGGPCFAGGDGSIGVAFTAPGATFTNSGTIGGGGGGSASRANAGGSGGAGVSFTAPGATFTNAGTVSGGAGGAGLGGGAGGVGVQVTGSGATFRNLGTVTGGSGSDPSGGGGAGIVGTGLTVINSGVVSAGHSYGGTLADAITFTGGTNILELRTGSTITGNVVAFSTADTLRLGGASDASFDVSQIGNQYLGFGLFQKTGGSTWTLIGANTASGPWMIDSGTLQVNAALASSNMTVNSGGTLAGIGTVGSVNVGAGGTLAPGAAGSPGTLIVVGNLAFQPGATYLVRLNSSNANSASLTTGGTAALAGTVEAAFATGSSVSRNYTILHTAGLGSSRFDGLQTSNLPGGFGATLDYTTTDALLELTATLGSATGPLSGNQQQVATALNNYFNTGGALPPSFVNVFALTGNNLNTALTQLSGEAGTGGQQAAFQLMTAFLTLMLDPFVDGRGDTVLGFAPNSDALSFQLASAEAASLTKSAPVAQGWILWGSAYGGVNHTNGDPAAAGSHDLTASTGGFAVGADYGLSPSTALGFAIAGGGTGWSVAEGLGRGNSTAFQAGIYGKTTFGPAYVAASLAYTQQWMSTDRLSFGFDQLTAQFDAESFGGRVESGYRFTLPTVAVTPYVGLQSQVFVTPSYSESDTSGGSFGLSYAGRTATATRSELGSRFDRTIALDPTTLLVLRAKLAWAHDWVSDPSLVAIFQGLPGASFIVRGATLPSDSGLVSTGAELHFANGLALAAKFDGEFAGRAHTLAGTAAVRYVW